MNFVQVELRPRKFRVERQKQVQLERWIERRFPGARATYEKTAHIPHSMPVWQSMLLAGIGQLFQDPLANVLEIGSARGGSAAIWGETMAQANILCVEPNQVKFGADLGKNLAPYSNISVWFGYSWDLLKFYNEEETQPYYDLIFVDGNHVLVHRDLGWWNYLKVGGLMLFDDYTPHIYPAVCAAVRDVWEAFGRQGPDIFARRKDRAGMVGLWRRSEDEVWPDTSQI